ncbi:septation protein IspZ [Silanimonas sp.]|jgi:intracellular septation protein A|uniref:septation protein IspZ n=1 Tax=Silanimonas sp. TaxID=1929290 RepID=UPI0022C80CB0|nr:septation protein IspZ [Silanimonas sp.]MCZ8116180.1 septation protein IspZ [Silanimonas sp.]
MALWTYRRRFALDGKPCCVEIEAGVTRVRSRLIVAGRALAEDSTWVGGGEYRNHLLRAALPDGRALEVEAGPATWYTYGIVVRVDGRLLHESHPGRAIVWPAWATGGASAAGAQTPEAQAELAAAAREDAERWKRNKPSILTDIALGILFFAVAKFTGSLTTAALVGAGVGIALVVVQRFVRVDLLGGFALFGIAVLLLSAAFAWVFQDDWAVKMRSTIVGSLVALVMLSDGLLNGGRYFGGRIQRYMPMPIDPRRFTMGMGVLGLVMAVVNYAVATWTTGDVWLWYTTFGDTVLGILLVFGVMQYAQRRAGDPG